MQFQFVTNTLLLLTLKTTTTASQNWKKHTKKQQQHTHIKFYLHKHSVCQITISLSNYKQINYLKICTK